MGLFSRSSKTSLASIQGSHEVVVIGDEQFPVVRTLKPGMAQKVTLERERGNRLDPNAILVRVNGSPAGYLSFAEDYAPLVTEQHSVQAVVKELYPSGRVLFVLMPLLRHPEMDVPQPAYDESLEAEAYEVESHDDLQEPVAHQDELSQSSVLEPTPAEAFDPLGLPTEPFEPQAFSAETVAAEVFESEPAKHLSAETDGTRAAG